MQPCWWGRSIGTTLTWSTRRRSRWSWGSLISPRKRSPCLPVPTAASSSPRPPSCVPSVKTTCPTVSSRWADCSTWVDMRIKWCFSLSRHKNLNCLFLYPTQQVVKGLMFFTSPSVLGLFVSATPLKPLNWILWNFVVIKNILCRCTYLQEILIWG